MNSEIFKGNWEQIKGKLKQKWGELTDDELLQIEGNSQRIFGILEERYGLAKDDAKKAIDSL